MNTAPGERRCHHCGYPLEGIRGVACPECGRGDQDHWQGNLDEQFARTSVRLIALISAGLPFACLQVFYLALVLTRAGRSPVRWQEGAAVACMALCALLGGWACISAWRLCSRAGTEANLRRARTREALGAGAWSVGAVLFIWLAVPG